MQLNIVHTELSFDLEFHEIQINNKQLVYNSDKTNVYAFPLDHRVETYGYIFQQAPKQGNINKEFVAKYTPSISEIKKIKGGSDFITEDGTLIKNEDITIPPEPQLSYAYCSDTRYNENTADFIKNVSVVYHEATFDNSFKELASERYHSTAADAALTALNANAGQLILGHFSARNTDTEVLLEEATDIFQHTIISEEGVEYLIQL